MSSHQPDQQPPGYQQTPPPGYPQTPPPGYQQTPPPGHLQAPPPGYQQSPPPGYPQAPPPGYQQTPPPGYQQTPPPGYQPGTGAAPYSPQVQQPAQFQTPPATSTPSPVISQTLVAISFLISAISDIIFIAACFGNTDNQVGANYWIMVAMNGPRGIIAIIPQLVGTVLAIIAFIARSKPTRPYVRIGLYSAILHTIGIPIVGISLYFVSLALLAAAIGGNL